jgi:hypothetical protein
MSRKSSNAHRAAERNFWRKLAGSRVPIIVVFPISYEKARGHDAFDFDACCIARLCFSWSQP